MKSLNNLVVFLLVLFFMPVSSIMAAEIMAENLRCEYRINPEGLDVMIPRLSWTLASDQKGQKQTAYRILVASSPEILAGDIGDLWNSGKVNSGETLHITYAGLTLVSRMKVWWKVQIWDRDGKPSLWSQPASWSMGLLKETDWEAQWIADPATVHNAEYPVYGYLSEMSNRSEVTKSVTIDMRMQQQFDAVVLYPARPIDTVSFLFPVRYRIEAANGSFVDAIVLVDKTFADEPDPGIDPMIFRFPPTTRRQVRLTVTRLASFEEEKHAFALAEMEVLGYGHNMALEAIVYASDSYETGSWATANLTDGKTGTERLPNSLPATLVRKSFNISGTIRKATAYVSALGIYEFRLNGLRVGDQLLAPEWTNYDKRVSYQTYDVTGLLRSGQNAAAAVLGEGWYAGELMMAGRFNYGAFPRFLLQLEIELEDGTLQTIVSDGSWHTTSNGPIRSAGIYDGENYDARLEQSGWDQPEFDDYSWVNTRTFSLDARNLVWLRNEPIRVEKELASVKMTEPEPGVYVFDLGQNMVGWCEIRAEGSSGHTVTVRHGEAINDDGTLYTANLRGDHQINYYTPNTNGLFVYEPRFTYHGFRYVELSGLAKPPTLQSVTGCVLHSSSPFTGSFECSDPSLNRLMENIQWTQRGNLMSSPNDCPQRDERLGWMGDIQVFAQTAIFNMDLAAFFTKFLQDTRDDQADDGRFPNYAPHPGDENQYNSGSPAWGDAGVFVPWTAYLNYADIRLLEEQFSAARRWIEYIHRNNPDLIWRIGRNNDYNDWLNGDQIIYDGWPKEGGEVPRDVFATAFFARSTEIISKMAEVLGRTEDVRYYSQLSGRIKETFNKQFVQPNGRIYGNTQGGYALALNFNLLPDTLRARAARYLVEDIQQRYNGHLSTGIQTSHRALHELTRNGHDQIAWQLLTDRSFPSWFYMIDNGATTIWERWDGYVKGRGFQDPRMNSLNHWALGSVGEWMWRNIIGLNPDESQPGWKHFTIAPRPGGDVTWACGEYKSIRGRIACSWEIKKDKLQLQATVPPNTTATIRIPTADTAGISKNGKIVMPNSVENECAVFEVESGTYHFVSPINKR